jgi:hypothetical protein
MAYYDSGYAPATTWLAVKKVWDSMLHGQVLDKIFFKGLIGKDKVGEEGVQDDISGFPIVEKTNLKKDSGDRITMSLLRQHTTGSRYNSGKTGNTQLVDSETTMTFHTVQVLIGHYRAGVAILGKTTEQRSPFALRSEARQMISTHLATMLDDGIFFALYSGYSPNIFREYGHAVAVPTTHGNVVYGKDKASLAALDAADTVDTDMMERLSVAVDELNIPPCRVKGDVAHIFIVHPRGLILASNKVDSALNHDALTVSSDVITLAAESDGAVTAANTRMNLLLGANAVARAFGKESYMARRKEDDYGNLIGFAGGLVYGDKRADWVVDDGTGATNNNQSSILVYSASPNVNTNLSAIWS